eukprot:TRINITY_DN95843_c0_g1_i1.p1 TRINITY_DN95843_c0_g1~~TRINITY_DN95843_c0_g1_i1.p1  ORF type:complete len:176 (-),score=18.12 TRINITY_DN95843_c0_g1_i1:51-578(-)
MAKLLMLAWASVLPLLCGAVRPEATAGSLVHDGVSLGMKDGTYIASYQGGKYTGWSFEEFQLEGGHWKGQLKEPDGRQRTVDMVLSAPIDGSAAKTVKDERGDVTLATAQIQQTHPQFQMPTTTQGARQLTGTDLYLFEAGADDLAYIFLERGGMNNIGGLSIRGIVFFTNDGDW